jgi:hypothetical protein
MLRARCIDFSAFNRIMTIFILRRNYLLVQNFNALQKYSKEME